MLRATSLPRVSRKDGSFSKAVDPASETVIVHQKARTVLHLPRERMAFRHQREQMAFCHQERTALRQSGNSSVLVVQVEERPRERTAPRSARSCVVPQQIE